MVSAVFHSPLEPSRVSTLPPPIKGTGAGSSKAPARRVGPSEDSASGNAEALGRARADDPAPPAARSAIDGREVILRIGAPLVGLGLLLAAWALISVETAGSIPSPVAVFEQALVIFAHPFYDKGPNDQGIGWNVLSSLGRVAIGFGLAAAVGIPAGFLIGRFALLGRMFNPLISLLRPVSPLAWLPIGLLVFKGANPAAIWTIFISSIWPMIINTAVGVQRVPADYMNVARVLNLSEWKIFSKFLFPAVLPYMLTGVRLAVGTAWLVIVAAEMLTGGAGIGFWLWDEWNNLNVAHIIIAIFIIGVVGLLLEALLVRIATAFTFEDVAS
jgi:nitrate/nitrite transport system permease protein